MEGTAAVDRLEHADVEHVDHVRVFGVGEDMREIPGALAQIVLGVLFGPRAAAVIGAENAAVARFHQGVYALGIRPRNGDADAPFDAARQSGSVRNILPGIAAIGRFPESAARAAAIHAPRLAADLPERSVEDTGIRRIHHDIGRARFRAARQHLLPRLAAIRRAIDAAFGVRPPEMAQRRYIGDIRIRRVNDNRSDVVRLLQADIAPGTPRIGGFVYAVAVRCVAAHAGLTHADIDRVGIGIRHCDGADRAGLEEAIGNGIPRESRIA